MTEQAEKARRFLELHHEQRPLLLPNPWDRGSAKLLASLGFQALATTSSGSAATLGKLDGAIGREGALDHAAEIVAATDLPVSADLENGFADDAEGVAETVHAAVAAGLAGCSVEDYSGDETSPIYELAEATERVAAAAEAAHGGEVPFVLTARAENYLHGRKDLEDTIERLQAYEQAGADVLYAPGLATAQEIRAVCDAVTRPVNVLGHRGLSVAEIFAAGAQRVSVGGGLTWTAVEALATTARQLQAGDLSGLRSATHVHDWLSD
jgi:2-methylisocitrate lyase-like PEP mutase family enzyme